MSEWLKTTGFFPLRIPLTAKSPFLALLVFVYTTFVVLEISTFQPFQVIVSLTTITSIPTLYVLIKSTIQDVLKPPGGATGKEGSLGLTCVVLLVR